MSVLLSTQMLLIHVVRALSRRQPGSNHGCSFDSELASPTGHYHSFTGKYFGLRCLNYVCIYIRMYICMCIYTCIYIYSAHTATYCLLNGIYVVTLSHNVCMCMY